ncbi:hypothetical protein [Sodalis sp. dw_96]|uniref:hypothetical protein n=1 Tax=Sodalis sp. dw_96 TaxID=2719794 RepID=UPI001BD6A015|nr:hypothetical protein [Sodalis sp. dw_96]
MNMTLGVKKNVVFCVLAFFILVNTWIYIAGEQLVYVWDFHGYWSIWQKYGEMFSHHFFQWLNENEHNIRGNDYNPLPVSLLFPFYVVLGDSRFAYILGLSLVYLGLTSWFLSRLFERLYDDRTAAAFFSLVMAALFVPFWRPTLRGFPDIVGLIPLVGAMLYVMNARFSLRVSLKKSLLLGLLLWTPFLLRRWYAYIVVTLFITLPVLSFWYDRLRMTATEFNEIPLTTRMNRVFIGFLFAGISTVILAYAFQSSLILRILRTNYSYEYSAYQSSFLWSVKYTLNGIGYYILPFAALGLLFALRWPGRKTSLICWFSLANLIISFVMFTRTQSPGIQHQLPFALWIFIIALTGLLNVVFVFQSRIAGAVMSIAIALCAVMLIGALYRGGPSVPDPVEKILPDKNYSLRLDHFENYRALVSVLTTLTGNQEKFAVLSSSGRLSDDLISTLSSGRLDAQMMKISQIDLRDKLRLEPFMAKYMVVADPVELHLSSGQYVVKWPAEALLSAQGIGAAYKKLPYDYVLDGNIHAYIFEKQRGFTDAEIAAFLERFFERYPEWRDYYAHSLQKVFLDSQTQLGDKWGRFDYVDDRALSAHPGENHPTVSHFTWYMDKLIVRSGDLSCKNADGVVVTITGPDSTEQTAKISNGASHAFDMKALIGKRITFTLDKNQNSACDSVAITGD